jgi:hypothetical protein
MRIYELHKSLGELDFLVQDTEIAAVGLIIIFPRVIVNLKPASDKAAGYLMPL